MTLKQWLYSFDNGKRMSADLVAAYTDAYFRDQSAKAVAAFDAAFLKMQPLIPVIDEKGEIEYRDGRKGTYAQNEDIQQAIGPILHAHGFMLAFETTHPTPEVIHVEGVLTHKRGHSRRSAFESLADLSGGKSQPQSRASVIAYGHRYTTCDLLNIVTRGADNDAQPGTNVISAATLSQFPQLCAAASQGMDALQFAWSNLLAEDRHLIPQSEWNTLKRIAAVKDETNAQDSATR